MSGGPPWSVKGIDPKAREVAKDLARRHGMTLGEWLNHVILEDDLPDEVSLESQIGERLRRFQEPSRTRGAAPTGTPDLARVAQALDRLTDRIEAAETRTGLAVSSVEHTLRQALGRVDTAERAQMLLGQRVESLEAGPRSPEALKALETRLAQVEARGSEFAAEAILQKLGERIAAAEARTAQAITELTGSLATLDARVGVVEGRGPRAEPRFEGLAQALNERVDALRAEVAERLVSATGGEVERRLAAMTAHVAASEARASQAVEDLGRQVLAMAEAVSRRLSQVDERNAEAIDQVGGEIARIAGAVELRLARAEQTQAQSFQRLSDDLARVTDQLSERLPPAPASALAPAERWPQAEEVLAAARQNRDPGAMTPPEPEPEAPRGPFGPELFSRAEPEPEGDELSSLPGYVPSSFAPIDETDDDIFEAVAAEPAEHEPRPLSTREVIEQARAAARAARNGEGEPVRPSNIRTQAATRGTGRLFQGFVGRPKARRSSSPMHTALMIAGGAAFLSVGAAGLTLMQGEGDGPSQGASPSRAAMALTPSRVAPASAPSVYETTRTQIEAGAPGAVARLRALAEAGDTAAQLYLAQLHETGASGLPQDLVEARRWTALAAEGGQPKAMHNLAVYYFRGDGGPQDLASAAQWFRKAAAQGVVESQYNLGLLYQSGSGVKQDLAEARRWFLRAAAKGDAQARAAADALSVGPQAGAAFTRNLPESQAALAQLGYYEGPVDGRDTPAYRAALSAYQRDTSQR